MRFHAFCNELSQKLKRFSENAVFSPLLAASHWKLFGIGLKVVVTPPMCLEWDKNGCETDSEGWTRSGSGAILVSVMTSQRGDFQNRVLNTKEVEQRSKAFGTWLIFGGFTDSIQTHMTGRKHFASYWTFSLWRTTNSVQNFSKIWSFHNFLLFVIGWEMVLSSEDHWDLADFSSAAGIGWDGSSNHDWDCSDSAVTATETKTFSHFANL